MNKEDWNKDLWKIGAEVELTLEKMKNGMQSLAGEVCSKYFQNWPLASQDINVTQPSAPSYLIFSICKLRITFVFLCTDQTRDSMKVMYLKKVFKPYIRVIKLKVLFLLNNLRNIFSIILVIYRM